MYYILDAEPDCPSLGLLDNILADCSQGDVYAFGAACTFTCEFGYNLIGEDIIACESGGVWSNDIPVCELSK